MCIFIPPSFFSAINCLCWRIYRQHFFSWMSQDRNNSTPSSLHSSVALPTTLKPTFRRPYVPQKPSSPLLDSPLFLFLGTSSRRTSPAVSYLTWCLIQKSLQQILGIHRVKVIKHRIHLTNSLKYFHRGVEKFESMYHIQGDFDDTLIFT